MATQTPEQVAAKWRDRLSQSGQQITEGVRGVQVAPGVKAAQSRDLWARRVMESKDKWAQRVAGVSLQEWQQKMIEVGIPRVASGAAANVGKVQDFMSEFLPYLDQGVQKVNAMPKGDLGASIARATAMIQHNANFKRRA